MQEDTKQPVQAAPRTHHTIQLTSLFKHNPFPHKPRNANELHKEELAAAGLNTRIAVGLTQGVGTMWTAYSFAVLAIIGLLAILGILSPTVALLVAWASQTFIQLVMLPIIMVGQNVLGRKSELQADEAFNTTMKTYHDIEEIMQHLSAQDAELLKQSHMIIHMLKASGIPSEQVMVIQNTGDIATTEVQAQG